MPRQPVRLPADFRHDVEHLPGYFPASLIVGGGFGWCIITKPGASVMYGIPGDRSLNDWTSLVGHAAGHQGNEIESRIGIGIVELGIRADRGAVLRISDQ